jgi:hypothetical protein
MTSRYYVSQYNTIYENNYIMNLTGLVAGVQHGLRRVVGRVMFAMNEIQVITEENTVMNGICESDI